jgi:hypothetical protein
VKLYGIAAALPALALLIPIAPFQQDLPTVAPASPALQTPVQSPALASTPVWAGSHFADEDTQSPYDEVAQIKRDTRLHAEHVATEKAAAAKAQALSQPSPSAAGGCTATNWRATMTTDEVWIDTRESTLDPYAANGQYHGLGQLGPDYAWTSDPCQQLADQRDYIANRYGSEDSAVDFWRANGWY